MIPVFFLQGNSVPERVQAQAQVPVLPWVPVLFLCPVLPRSPVLFLCPVLPRSPVPLRRHWGIGNLLDFSGIGRAEFQNSEFFVHLENLESGDIFGICLRISFRMPHQPGRRNVIYRIPFVAHVPVILFRGVIWRIVKKFERKSCFVVLGG